MPDNSDYEEVISGTVSEAKAEIQELEDPDYRKILQLERENKNRKTLKEWLEERVDESEEVEEDEPESFEEVMETPVAEEEVPETLTRNQLMAGGLVIGILIGLAVGVFALDSGSAYEVSNSQVQESVQDYVDQIADTTPQVSSAEVTGVTRGNGMYLVNVTVSTQLRNQTTENTAVFYVTGDGSLMFPNRAATNLEEATQRLKQRAQQPQNTTR